MLKSGAGNPHDPMPEGQEYHPYAFPTNDAVANIRAVKGEILPDNCASSAIAENAKAIVGNDRYEEPGRSSPLQTEAQSQDNESRCNRYCRIS